LKKHWETEWLERHRRIVEFLNKGSGIVSSVTSTARELGMDPRTLRTHLEVIRIDGAGDFLDPQKKTFCTRKGIISLVQKLGIRVKEP